MGLAAYAGAAIAGSDPIKTGIQGFTYDMRTAILPFVFIFNTQLLMISGVAENGDIIWLNNVFVLAWVFVVSLFAIFAFASFMQGYFADDCNWLERLLLLAIAILIFRPALVAGDIGLPRELIQAVAVAVYIALYFYQKRRRKQREPGTPAAQAG